MSKWFFRLGVLGVLIIVGLLLRDQLSRLFPQTPNQIERLKDNEKEKITITDRGDVVRVKRNGQNPGDQVAFKDYGAGRTTITIDTEGKVHITQETHGFVFRPAICFGTDKRGLVFGTDLQFYYLRNFGANVGLTTSGRGNLAKDIKGHISISYRLPFESFRNTSFYVGFTTEKSVQIGSRIRY